MSGLCPHHGKALRPQRVSSGRQIESCPQCQGLWLLPATVASLVGHVLHPAAVAALPPARPFAVLPCPVDGSGMRALRSHGVEIDLCARCRGVWLDAGELEQLLALNPPQEESGAEDALEGALDVALEFGDLTHGRGHTGKMSAGRSSDAATSDSGLSLVEIESTGDSRMLLEQADPTPLLEASGGMLDSAGEAIGAVFEFVGDALSGL
ncbi:MAG: TFIIB-type zinc ribbon-containing protein [Pseudomarimonas sp.]